MEIKNKAKTSKNTAYYVSLAISANLLNNCMVQRQIKINIILYVKLFDMVSTIKGTY